MQFAEEAGAGENEHEHTFAIYQSFIIFQSKCLCMCLRLWDEV